MFSKLLSRTIFTGDLVLLLGYDLVAPVPGGVTRMATTFHKIVALEMS